MTISGPVMSAILVHSDEHSDKWAEAWRIVYRTPGGGHDAFTWYLVRIALNGQHGIGFVLIDDAMVADARAADLPLTLGITTQILAILPAEVDEQRARFVMRFLARKAVRDLPMPPTGPADVATWRSAIDTLADVAVNQPLTGITL